MRHGQQLLTAALCAVVAFVALALAGDAAGPVAASAREWFHPLVFSGVAIACWLRVARCARGERAAWAAMATALTSYAAGSVLYSATLALGGRPTFPSTSDALWLAFFPLTTAALVLLARSRSADHDVRIWLEGLLGALALGGVGAAIVYQPIFDANAASAAGLAYPIGGLMLTGFVVATLGAGGWRLDRSWMLLGAGFALVAVSDSAYVVQAAGGDWRPGTLLDVPYALGLLLVASAAWTPPRTAPARSRELRLACLPVAFGASAGAIEVYASVMHLNPLAHTLNALALVVALLRLGIAFRDHASLLVEVRREATTDSVTGLGNRRQLLADLDEVAAQASPERRWVIALYDLDGFKRYNDTFGHGAGDALLARVGQRLELAVTPAGRAYRIGGDEFCVLAPCVDGWRDCLFAAKAALRDEGEGFTVGASAGRAILPDDAADPLAALRLADHRMYAEKHARPRLGGRETGDLVLRVLAEGRERLDAGRDGVAALAVGVGRRLGLVGGELLHLRHAAELRDIGKIALPDEILRKRGPLSDEEWRFVRRHTLIGERFLAAVPSLHAVGEIVRATHERWDGAGYPDGLAGADIPLGARIVAVCDAFRAMTTDRPYRDAVRESRAIEELRRCAGSQFDPRVVEAFVSELTAAHAREPALA